MRRGLLCLIGGLLFPIISFALTPTQFMVQYNMQAPKEYQLLSIGGGEKTFFIAKNSHIALYVVGSEIMMVILNSDSMTPEQLKASIADFNAVAGYVILATQTPFTLQQAQQLYKNVQLSNTGSYSLNNITYVLSGDENSFTFEVDF